LRDGFALGQSNGMGDASNNMSDLDALAKIKEPLIRRGVEEAVCKTLKIAMLEKAYPGHFTVTADGSGFGTESTWPGLDSWELAGAYLILGYDRLVTDYFEYVKASQRNDGNIPFAILPAEQPPASMDTYYRGLNYPEDIFTYSPGKRVMEGVEVDYPSKKWIGLFKHWQTRANPLSVLGPVSHILTAYEIFMKNDSVEWLGSNIESIDAAASHVLSRKSKNGLISGAGFYIEMPPRSQWDGITQCYAHQAFKCMQHLHLALDDQDKARHWLDESQRLKGRFDDIFWTGDHYAEYLHQNEHLVDSHGLSDVNWAAIAFDLADDRKKALLWPQLMKDKSFWFGGMPTMLVTKPFTYESWEFHEELPFDTSHHGPLYDVAAMGRVWYLEAMACIRMGNADRVVESVLKVCETGERHDWYWHERYHPLQNGQVYASGPRGYCEYAAVLVRIVLGNMALFE